MASPFFYSCFHSVHVRTCRYQVSVACFVAMETLDPYLCDIAVKRVVQKLSAFLDDETSQQKDELTEDVLKLLQLIYSKVGLIYCAI